MGVVGRGVLIYSIHQTDFEVWQVEEGVEIAKETPPKVEGDEEDGDDGADEWAEFKPKYCVLHGIQQCCTRTRPARVSRVAGTATFTGVYVYARLRCGAVRLSPALLSLRSPPPSTTTSTFSAIVHTPSLLLQMHSHATHATTLTFDSATTPADRVRPVPDIHRRRCQRRRRAHSLHGLGAVR